MSRADLKIEKGGFPIYQDSNLPKVNAWRRAASMVKMQGPPILTRGQVSFSTAESANDEPRSCFNCYMMNTSVGRCEILGPRVKIAKFTEGAKDGNPIEYWPVCGYWIHGEPSTGEIHYHASLDPEDAGLGWVNAPKPGLALSGSCCGGGNDGDDCDLWVTEDKEAKWDATTGFCRVLQTITANLDCCSCFTDDDWLPWQTAQQFLKDKP